MARSRKSSSRSRRRQQRAASRPQPRPATPAAGAVDAASAEPTSVSTSGTAATSRSSTSAAPSQRGSRSNPRLTVGGPSRLTERAIEEYHYVGRDLRNIFTLVVVMAVLLAVAYVAFTTLGIGHTA